MKTDVKKLLILNLPYLFIGYFADKLGWLYRVAEGGQSGEKLLYVFLHFVDAFASKLPCFHPMDLMVGVMGAAIMRGVVYYRCKNAKKYRHGVEYGSARWSA